MSKRSARVKAQQSAAPQAVKATLSENTEAPPLQLVQTSIKAYYRPRTPYYLAADKELASYYSSKVCEVCFVRSEEETVECCICEDLFHTKCLLVKEEFEAESEWTCSDCQKERTQTNDLAAVCSKREPSLDLTAAASANVVQKSIDDYFPKVKARAVAVESFEEEKSTECSKPSLLLAQTPELEIEEVCALAKAVKRPAKSKLSTQKQRSAFRLPRYATAESRRVNKMALAAAMTAKNMVFDDELSYPHESCPRSANNPTIYEPLMQKLDAKCLRIFRLFKQLSQYGEYGNVQVVFDDIQGYVVQATAAIPALTLICEYVGEVDLTRKHLFDVDHDDIFDLIRSNRSKNSLVICPSRRGNIARFISGINNYSKQSAKQVNLRSARFAIGTEAHVILFARRAIQAGERLHYDYNALASQYKTDHFV